MRLIISGGDTVGKVAHTLVLHYHALACFAFGDYSGSASYRFVVPRYGE